jgi:TetR/AcrR family transcriptional regulator, tetracycline repressor protein
MPSSRSGRARRILRTTRRKTRRPASSPRTLSRSRVLKEALTLLDREGAERFSIRRLAEHLGVTPMAVYNHVSSKGDLFHGIADAVIEEIKYPSPAGDWRKVIRSCFRALRRACLAHPGAVPLIESAEVLPPAVFQPMETTLTALQAAGFSPGDALRAYFLLTTFTLGQISYQIKGWGGGVDVATAIKAGRIAPETFPAIGRGASLTNWNFDKSFEFGLSIILAGLTRRTSA